MPFKIKPVLLKNCTLEMPADKSISHRALIFGALCNGDVHISNLSECEDCNATMACLEDLGITITHSKANNYVVHGKGLFGFSEPENVLDSRNSGTTTRLLTGLLAAQPFYSILNGDRSLRNRPMNRVIDPLTKMGASITSRNKNRKPPLTVVGKKLKPIEYSLPVPSAQVKSALLLAGLFCSGRTVIREPVKTRDHTERMLNFLDANISFNSNQISISGSELKPAHITIPGDISSASYFLTAAVLSKDSQVCIKNVGLNPGRTGCINALIEMGANLYFDQTGIVNGEPIGDIHASGSNLKGKVFGPEQIPSMIDEIPILALAATQASGKTVMHGVNELRFKECDRLTCIANELNKMGAHVVVFKDKMVIQGPTTLRGTYLSTYSDHRMAMTLTIAGLIASGESVLDEIKSVSVSFPGFYDMLRRQTGTNHDEI